MKPFKFGRWRAWSRFWANDATKGADACHGPTWASLAPMLALPNAAFKPERSALPSLRSGCCPARCCKSI
jgi:hypothetical protein